MSQPRPRGRPPRPRGRPRRNQPDEVQSNRIPGNNQGQQPNQPPGPRNENVDPIFAAFQQFMQFYHNQERNEAAILNHLPRNVAPQSDQVLERFLRFQPPKFLGEPDDFKAEAWMDQIENIFEALNYTDEQRIVLAVFRLEDAARQWWRVTEMKWARENTQRNWANFSREFNNKYVPQVVRDKRENEFLNLRQGNLSVAQYEAQFSKLLRYAPHFLDDGERCTKKFIKGLQFEIQKSLVPLGICAYSEAIERAMLIESEFSEIKRLEEQVKRPRPTFSIWHGNREQGRGQKFQRTYQGGTSNLHIPQKEANQGFHQNAPACEFCGVPGHTEGICWKKAGKCSRCGSDQHKAKDCPKYNKRLQQPMNVIRPRGKEVPGGRPRVQARAYALEGQSSLNPTSVIEGEFQGGPLRFQSIIPETRTAEGLAGDLPTYKV